MIPLSHMRKLQRNHATETTVLDFLQASNKFEKSLRKHLICRPTPRLRHDQVRAHRNQTGWWTAFFMWTVILGLAVFVIVYLYFVNYGAAGGSHAQRDNDARKDDATDYPRDGTTLTTEGGHVGGSCSATQPCMEAGECVDNVCTCQGDNVRITNGICVKSSTSTETTSPSTKATTSVVPTTYKNRT
ncbi:hypothetical protein HPB50_006564 [Hyalomma asiaticum]|uniref:Uncharacterized protein n=1 Tax=Hyalomma asiaticum TaxID=266040 RepID=A0ACB7RPN4_HYAAI|nr:hypothetical protein HPB50_006564 [Hyalomma asiaticum]